MQVVPLLTQRVAEQVVVVILVFDWHILRITGCTLNRTSLQLAVYGWNRLGQEITRGHCCLAGEASCVNFVHTGAFV